MRRKQPSRRRIKARANLGQRIARYDIERHRLWTWREWFAKPGPGDYFVTYDPKLYAEYVRELMEDYSRMLVEHVSRNNVLLRLIGDNA